MPIFHYPADQKSSAWYKIRTVTPITASIISTIIRSKPESATYKALVVEKASKIRSEWNLGPAVLHGLRCEPLALARLRSKYRISEVGFITNTDYPDMGVSPDGIIFYMSNKGDKRTRKTALLEIKCPYSRVWTGLIPPAYVDQMQMQMLVSGIHTCFYYECYFRHDTDECTKSWLKVLRFDETWFEEHKPKIDQFVNDVKNYCWLDHLSEPVGDSVDDGSDLENGDEV